MSIRIINYDDTIEDFRISYNLTSQDVGDISALDTSASSLVLAINEVHGERDSLDTRVGSLSNLGDMNGHGIVATNTSVTRVIDDFWVDYYTFLGRGTALQTASNNIVGGINEIEANFNSLNQWVGTRDLSNFSSLGAVITPSDLNQTVNDFWEDYYNFLGRGIAFTTNSSNVVGAVNELELNHNNLDSRVGALSVISSDIRGGTIGASINLLDTKFENWTGHGTTLNTVATNLADAINELELNHNNLESRVGALSVISSDIRGASVVISLNNIDSKFENWTGHGTALLTTASNLSAAINEIHGERDSLDTRVGALSVISSDIRGASIAASFNLLDQKFENWTGHGQSLNTTANTLVAAINEIHDERDSLDARVGLLTSLDADFTGSSRDSIISALNFLRDFDTQINSTVGLLSSLSLDIRGASVVASVNLLDQKFENWTGHGTTLLTTASNLSAAINEIHGTAPANDADKNLANLSAIDSRIGPLTDLDADISGSNRSSIVNAINFIYGLQSGQIGNFTSANVSGDLDVGGNTTVTGNLVAQGTFNSRGIDDNATAERLQIDNSLITARTNLSVLGSITATSALTLNSISLGSDFVKAGSNSLIRKTGSSDGIGVGSALNTSYFYSGSNSLTYYTSDADSNDPSRLFMLSDGVARIVTGINASHVGQTWQFNANGTLDAPGAISISGNTVWHAGNDGTGSGLDADLLDGVQLSSLARTDVAETFTQPVTFNNNVTFNGTVTTVNTETLNVADNIIELNSNVTGTPTEDSGITVNRGTSNNVSLLWDESEDDWYLNKGGSFSRILTTSDTGSNNGLDADTVDGYQASNLAILASNNTFTGHTQTIDSNTAVRNRLNIKGAGVNFTSADILLEDNSGLSSRALGLYMYNTSSGNEWYVGQPYDGNETYFDISYSYQNNGSQGGETADVSNYMLRVFNNGNLTVKGSTILADGNTVWHAGNDGAGSTLDSDLLDGQHGSYYRDASNLNTGTLSVDRIPSTIDKNLLIGDGTNINPDSSGLGQLRIDGSGYRGFVALNGVAMHIGHTSGSRSLVFMTNETSRMEISGSGAVTIGGNTVWHAGNDGAGSTLDSDLLDGQHGSYYLAWNNLTGVPSTFTPSAHTHPWSEITSTPTTLAGYGISATEVRSVLLTVDGATSGLDADLLDGQHGSYYLAWDNLTGVPSVFAPSAHTHPWSEITSTPTTLAGYGISATEVRSVLLTVDGPGSGLDADTLDGFQAANFLREDGNGHLTISGNQFTHGESGNYWTSSSTQNSFYTTHGYIQLGPSNSSFAHIYTDMPEFYFNKQLRVLGGLVWHSSNDGSGSGLDSDLLDGQHGSYYLAWSNLTGVPSTFTPSAHSHAASDITSGTLDIDRIPSIPLSKISGSSVITSAESFTDSNSFLLTAAATLDLIQSQSPVLDVIAGTGISVTGTSNKTVAVNMGAFSTSDLAEGSNLYYTSARVNSAIDGRVDKAFVDALGVNASHLNGLSFSSFIRSAVDDTVSANTEWQDGFQVRLGTSADMRFHHTGSVNYIDLYNGNLLLRQNTTTKFTFERSTGNFTATGNVTAYSDERLKKDFFVIPNALDKIESITGYEYYWNEKAREVGITSKDKQIGVLAQEVEKAIPEVVHEDDSNIKQVDYSKLVPVLIESIKELSAKVKELEGQINGY